MTIRPLRLVEVRLIAFEIARLFLEKEGEPIPLFETRRPHILETCLETPFQTFMGVDPHPSLEEKGALLFYMMSQRHPFENGNKRVALTSLYLFMMKNGRWIETSDQELVAISRKAAASDSSKEQNRITEEITVLLKTKGRPLSE